jgi:hypothetical protein
VTKAELADVEKSLKPFGGIWGYRRETTVLSLQRSPGTTAAVGIGQLAGVDFARRRQLLVFGRFLACVVALFGDAVLLYAPTRNFCGMGRKSICFALSSEHD